MARIPDHEIERLKMEVSLLRLVEAKGIALKKSGDNRIGCCPFHDDKTPSLIVSEAKNLWSAVPPATPVVVLDERGKTMSSAAFARFLSAQADSGAKQLTFMIGGPDGHDPETRAKALQLLGFGPMTFPHRLVRVMLLEQIYRAVTILVNHPYHRN